jgi:hypothetical protein
VQKRHAEFGFQVSNLSAEAEGLYRSRAAGQNKASGQVLRDGSACSKRS